MDFPNTDDPDFRIVFYNGFQIGTMIYVPMGKQDVVASNGRNVHGLCKWIAGNEWVEKDPFAARFDEKARMTVEGDFHTAKKNWLIKFIQSDSIMDKN